MSALSPAGIACATLVLGCGESLATAPTGAYPARGAEPLVVEYPPPPAQVEFVPKQPRESCVWVDGHWNWIARGWQWVAGSWVIAPADCYYAQPSMVWLPSSQGSLLYYLPPRWYPKGAEQSEEDQPLERCAEPRACVVQTGGAVNIRGSDSIVLPSSDR